MISPQWIQSAATADFPFCPNVLIHHTTTDPPPLYNEALIQKMFTHYIDFIISQCHKLRGRYAAKAANKSPTLYACVRVEHGRLLRLEGYTTIMICSGDAASAATVQEYQLHVVMKKSNGVLQGLALRTLKQLARQNPLHWRDCNPVWSSGFTSVWLHLRVYQRSPSNDANSIVMRILLMLCLLADADVTSLTLGLTTDHPLLTITESESDEAAIQQQEQE